MFAPTTRTPAALRNLGLAPSHHHWMPRAWMEFVEMENDPAETPADGGRRAALAQCLNKSPDDFQTKRGSRPNCYLMALPLGASAFGTRKVYSVLTDREALLAPPAENLVTLGEREIDGVKYLVFRDP